VGDEGGESERAAKAEGGERERRAGRRQRARVSHRNAVEKGQNLLLTSSTLAVGVATR
jgi:hypothetical protein